MFRAAFFDIEDLSQSSEAIISGRLKAEPKVIESLTKKKA